MPYYREIVHEYTNRKPEKEERKSAKEKKRSRGDSDEDDKNGESSAAKKKQNVERVAVNLAETQEAKFQKLQDAFGALEASPGTSEYKTTTVQVKSEVKEKSISPDRA